MNLTNMMDKELLVVSYLDSQKACDMVPDKRVTVRNKCTGLWMIYWHG